MPCTCGIPRDNGTKVSKCSLFFSIKTALLFLITGIYWYSNPNWRQSVKTWIIQKTVIVHDAGSLAFKSWQQLPESVELQLKVYMFNITNRNEILQGAKPELQEVGPFVYDINTEKVNITFYENGTASYQNFVTLHYNHIATRLHTNLTHDSNITFVNVPLVVINNIANKYNVAVRTIITPILAALGENQIIITKPVKDFLWGYPDPALTKLKPLLSRWVPDIDNKFGMLQGQNESYAPGEITVDLGTTDYARANSILRINGFDKLPFWNSEFSNSIYGTDAQQMPPSIERGQKLEYFSRDLFRSVSLDFVSETKVNGVSAYRYQVSNGTWDWTRKENHGFCIGECPLNGVMDLSPAYPMNAPIFASKPHFLGADEFYPDLLGDKSLRPNEEKHETWNDVEPVSGFLIGVHRRIQVNIKLERSTLVSTMKKIQPVTYLPTLWYGIEVEVDDTNAVLLKFVTQLSKFLYRYLATVAILISVFLILGITIRVSERLKSRNNYQLVENMTDSMLESSRLDLDNGQLRTNDDVNGVIVDDSAALENEDLLECQD